MRTDPAHSGWVPVGGDLEPVAVTPTGPCHLELALLKSGASFCDRDDTRVPHVLLNLELEIPTTLCPAAHMCVTPVVF